MANVPNAPIEEPDVQIFEKVKHIINKDYLTQLSSLPVQPLPQAYAELNVENTACLFPVKKVVYDRAENNIEKLASVYSGAASIGADLVMLLDGSGDDIRMYLGVCGKESRGDAKDAVDVLYRNFTGNFPGCKLENSDQGVCLNLKETGDLIDRCTTNYDYLSVVSGISTLRTRKDADNAAFVQGIEKVVEAMDGAPFSAIIIAESVSPAEITKLREDYEKLYYQLSPFAKYVYSVSNGISDAVTKSLTSAISETVNSTLSSSSTVGTSTSANVNVGVQANSGVSAGVSVPVTPGAALSGSGFQTVGGSLGLGMMLGKSRTEGEGISVGTGKSISVTDSNGVSYTLTESNTVQLSYENKTVSQILERIDLHLKRLRSAEGTGMFAVSAYFLSDTSPKAKSAGSTYKAIISGENTGLEDTTLNSWAGRNQVEPLLSYLQKLRHPVFLLDSNMTVTAASMVTAAELALHMGLPKTKIRGIPVRESVGFGRNVLKTDGTPFCGKHLKLGHVYHLGRAEETQAHLDLETLLKHTLVCGTTGSGKSNLIYVLLELLIQSGSNIHFMVIEPVKGDYKKDLSHMKNVKVYGTNPLKTPLLKLDPFYFPEGTTVQEHLDHLVDLLNVCWPMYAAMPAVLKRACQQAYVAAGWDMKTFTNRHHVRIFPTFADVAREVRKVMEDSAYSQDNKSDYIGSLCTRLDSMSTGINALLFSSDTLTDHQLFEENIIIDLSRMGSPESKSLIMGLLVLRLQEYRRENQTPYLQHVSILEEAHQLLKRTSTEQSMESANLVGRSVEMLSHALAEMRSVGEAYIIADQSPGAIDISAVNNTNTKIALCLPNGADREMLGRTMGLNQEQIGELAMLPTGVAAVYQNGWQEAVLVQVPKFQTGNQGYTYTPVQTDDSDEELASLIDAVVSLRLPQWLDRPDHTDERILRMQLPTGAKIRLLEYRNAPTEKRANALANVAYELFNTAQALETSVCHQEPEQWQEHMRRTLEPSVRELPDQKFHTLMGLLLCAQCLQDRSYINMYTWYLENLNRKGPEGRML